MAGEVTYFDVVEIFRAGLEEVLTTSYVVP